MKRVKIMLIAVIVMCNVMYAGQRLSGNSQNRLTAMQNQIDECRKIIRETPIKMAKKIVILNRLKVVGNEIQKALVLYIKTSQDCMENADGDLLERMCRQYSDLNVGVIISQKKIIIQESIEETNRELVKIKEIKIGIPILKAMIDSLEGTKKIRMGI